MTYKICPKNAYLINNTCACNDMFHGRDEFKIYADCHIPVLAFFALYGIAFLIYVFLFTQIFLGANRRANTFQPRRVMIYHQFLGVFSACAGLRILIGMAGYRYYQQHLSMILLEWFAAGSWISSILVVLSLWMSIFQTLRENSKIYMINIVTSIMIMVTHCLYFISQVLPIIRPTITKTENSSSFLSRNESLVQNSVNDYSITYYCSLILIALPLMFLFLVTVLRICVWYFVSWISSSSQTYTHDLDILQSEIKKNVISMTVCDIVLMIFYALIIIKPVLLHLYGYLIFSCGTAFVGVTTYHESKFLNPKANRIPSSFSVFSMYPTEYSPNIPSHGWSPNITNHGWSPHSFKTFHESRNHTLNRSPADYQRLEGNKLSVMELSYTKSSPLEDIDSWKENTLTSRSSNTSNHC